MDRIEIVKQFNQHLSSGAREKALTLLADDAVWYSDEIGGPWSGTHTGKQAISEFFIKMGAAVSDVKKELHDYMAKGNKVVEFSSLSCHINKTGKPFKTDLICVYMVGDDGKITSYRVFENSLKLYNAYYPEALDIISDVKIRVLTTTDSPKNYIFDVFASRGYDIEICINMDQLIATNNPNEKVIYFAVDAMADVLWQLNRFNKNVYGLILLHPDVLHDFDKQRLGLPCMIIYSSNHHSITDKSLSEFSRPRPEIPQFISDDLVDAFYLYDQFIESLCSKEANIMAEVVTAQQLKQKQPVAYPGAIPVLNKKRLSAGVVQLKDFDSYSHTNMDEVMYVVSGTATYRSGNEQPVAVKAGDFIYVPPFIEHQWSEQSEDLTMVFVQIPRTTRPIVGYDRKHETEDLI